MRERSKIASRTKNTVLNISSGLLLTGVTAISGLILPRLMIPTYGSEINGLISTITQFLSYISLLEAGIGGVIRSALYGPLAKNDSKCVSGIINATQAFYRKVGSVFVCYIIILCIAFPLSIAKDFSPLFVIALVVILSIGTLLQYFVSLPYVALINADQLSRICSFVDIITICVNIVLTYALIRNGSGVLTVRFLSCLVYAARPLCYYLYVKTHYSLDKTVERNNEAIKQRWNGFAHHIAFFIHHNTDIVVISTFIGLKAVSVYSVYYAVASGVEKAVTAISTGVAPSLGNVLVTGSKEKINEIFNVIEFVQNIVTTVLFTTASLLVIPFMRLYTRDMNDANYIEPSFAQLMLLAEAIYCIRLTYSTTSFSANKYKETQAGAIMECAINIVLSLIMVSRYGIIGVACGTVVAMCVRCLFDVFYLSKHVLGRSISLFCKTITVNAAISIISIIACKKIISYEIASAFSWCICGVESICVIGIIAGIFAILFYKKECMVLLSKFSHKK